MRVLSGKSVSFSGHDTFHCRDMWLTKAYDYRHVPEGSEEERNSFSGMDPIVEMGVGKNMVQSIRYWSKAFGTLDDQEAPTALGTALLNGGGWDTYLEDIGSLWLLHTELVLGRRASLYTIMFNELLQSRQEFTVDTVVDFVQQSLPERKLNLSTLKKDFSVFCRTYYANFEAKDLEESFNGLLTELRLLEKERRIGYSPEGKQQFQDIWVLERKERPNLPEPLVLYSILRGQSISEGESKSIGFDQLLRGKDGPGNIFVLSRSGLAEQLQALEERYPKSVRFSRQAGIEEFQIKQAPEAFTLLNDYYGC